VIGGVGSVTGLNPPEVGVPVELGERVEERRGRGLGLEGGGDVRGEVASLRSLGCEHDGDLVAT
jgi:hypothetical protein